MAGWEIRDGADLEVGATVNRRLRWKRPLESCVYSIAVHPESAAKRLMLAVWLRRPGSEPALAAHDWPDGGSPAHAAVRERVN